MRQVFNRLAKVLDVPLHIAYTAKAREHIESNARVFLSHWSSQFSADILSRPDARILHVIRDPRDILLSGARYHCKAPERAEPFLHQAREDLGGQTYQQLLNTLDPLDQLRFEMNEKHAQTVSEMLAWDYKPENRIELRYETLMQDRLGWYFFRALRQLGLKRLEAMRGRRIFLRRSLFGGLAEEENRTEHLNNHIADGSVEQWRNKLPRPIAEEYAERFGTVLVSLGYEAHPTAWLDKLEQAA